MVSLTIKLDSELYKELEKRAKREFLEVDELVEDIIRRSMISYNKSVKTADKKVDDTLVNIFSRSKKGRQRKTSKEPPKLEYYQPLNS